MSTTTTTDTEKNFLASNYTVFVIQINKKMLYYNIINEKDGVDYSEMKNMVKTTKDISKQCQYCNFYYFITQNFKRSKYYCDGCFFCKVYERNSKGLLIFRVVKTREGHFRTVSSDFLIQVQKQLTKNDLKQKFGWILSKNEAEKHANSGISMWNRTTISHE